MVKKFIYNLFKPKLEREAFEAYFDKLPNRIKVKWFRDGKFIIGEIEAEGDKFLTQATSANEFIEMVNDTLFAFYEIPSEYINDLLQYKRFVPPESALELLRDGSIRNSKISFEKRLVTV